MGILEDLQKIQQSDTEKIIELGGGGSGFGQLPAHLRRQGVPMVVDPVEQDNQIWNAFMAGAISPVDFSIRYMGSVFNSETAMEVADSIKEFRENHFRVDAPTFWTDLAGASGSMATFFIPSLLTGGMAGVVQGAATAGRLGVAIQSLAKAGKIAKILKAAGVAIPTAMEAMAEAGAMYDDTLMETGDEQLAQENANKSFFANAAIVGVTNKLSGIFEWADELSIGNRLVRSILTEGTQEASQEMIHDKILTGEIDIGAAAYSGLLGAIVGGGASLVTGGVAGQPERRTGDPEVEDTRTPGQITEDESQPLRESVRQQVAEAQRSRFETDPGVTPVETPVVDETLGDVFKSTETTVAQSPGQAQSGMTEEQLAEHRREHAEVKRDVEARERRNDQIQREMSDVEMQRVLETSEQYMVDKVLEKQRLVEIARGQRQRIIDLNNDLDYAHDDLLNRVNLGFVQQGLLNAAEAGKADESVQPLIPTMKKLHTLFTTPNIIAEPSAKLDQISKMISEIQQVMSDKDTLDQTNYTNMEARTVISKGLASLKRLQDAGIKIQERQIIAKEGTELSEAEKLKKENLKRMAEPQPEVPATTAPFVEQVAEEAETQRRESDILRKETQARKERADQAALEGRKKVRERDLKQKAETEAKEQKAKEAAERKEERAKELKRKQEIVRPKPKVEIPKAKTPEAPVKKEKKPEKPASALEQQLGKFTKRPATKSKLGERIPLSEKAKKSTTPKPKKKTEPKFTPKKLREPKKVEGPKPFKPKTIAEQLKDAQKRTKDKRRKQGAAKRARIAKILDEMDNFVDKTEVAKLQKKANELEGKERRKLINKLDQLAKKGVKPTDAQLRQLDKLAGTRMAPAIEKKVPPKKSEAKKKKQKEKKTPEKTIEVDAVFGQLDEQGLVKKNHPLFKRPSKSRMSIVEMMIAQALHTGGQLHTKYADYVRNMHQHGGTTEQPEGMDNAEWRNHPDRIISREEWAKEVDLVSDAIERNTKRVAEESAKFKDMPFATLMKAANEGDTAAGRELQARLNQVDKSKIEDQEDDRFYTSEDEFVEAGEEIVGDKEAITPEEEVKAVEPAKKSVKKKRKIGKARAAKIAKLDAEPLRKRLLGINNQIRQAQDSEMTNDELIADLEAQKATIEDRLAELDPIEKIAQKETEVKSKKVEAEKKTLEDIDDFLEGGDNVVVDSVKEIDFDNAQFSDEDVYREFGYGEEYEQAKLTNPDRIDGNNLLKNPRKLKTHQRQIQKQVDILNQYVDTGSALPTKVVATPNHLPTKTKDGIKAGDLRRGLSESEYMDGLMATAAVVDHTEGVVYLVASNISSPNFAKTLWLHEQVGHHGLQQMFKNDAEFKEFTNGVYAEMRREMPQEMWKSMKNYTTKSTLKDSALTMEEKHIIVAETLARMSEKMGTKLRESVWTKLQKFLKKWVQKLGLQARTPTLEDAKMLLEASHRYILKGKDFAPIRTEASSLTHSRVLGALMRRVVGTPESVHDLNQVKFEDAATPHRGALMRLWEIKDEMKNRVEVIAMKLEEDLYRAMGKTWDFDSADPFKGAITNRDQEVIKTGRALNMYRDSFTVPERRELALDYMRELESQDKLSNIQKRQLEILKRADQISKGTDKKSHELRKLAHKLTMHYDRMFEEAKGAGILNTHIEGYGKRIWKAPKKYKDIWNSPFGDGFSSRLTSAKQRTFSSIVEGWKLGMELQSDGAIDNLHAYANEMINVVGNLKYAQYGTELRDSTGKPLFAKKLDEKTIKKWGYRKVNGGVFEAQDIYAPEWAAKYLNKVGKTDDIFERTPFLKKALEMQSGLKGMILTMSPFHYWAGMRSWYFGIDKKDYKKLTGKNPGSGFFWGSQKAYRMGLELIRSHDAMLMDGIRNGLTFNMGQDVSLGRSNVLMRFGDWANNEAFYNVGEKLHTFNQNNQRNLFKKFFSGLKAQAYIVKFTGAKYKAELKKGTGLNPAELQRLSEETATLINADFGGLHLGRMGRSKELQKVARMFLLAPDWTESNFRTVTGAFGVNKFFDRAIGDLQETPGMSKVYRDFWIKALFTKIIPMTALATAAGLLMASPEDREQYYKNVLWSEKIYTSPISGLYDLLNINKKGQVPIMNIVAGHFADPIKLLDPARLMKGKMGPLGRALEQVFWSQTDYRGIPFKGTSEFLADAAKGEFGTLQDTPYDQKKQWWDQLIPNLVNSTKGMFPIPAQATMRYLMGEDDILTGIFQAAGMHKGTGWDKQKEWKAMQEITSEINAIDSKMKDAMTIGNRELLKEAKEEKADYRGFWQIKARLNATKTRLRPINRKLKRLQTVSKHRAWTRQEELQYKLLKSRRAKIIQPLLTVYNKYQ